MRKSPNWPFVKINGRPAVRTQVDNPMALKGQTVKFRRSGNEGWTEGYIEDIRYVGSSRILELEVAES